MHRFYTHSRKMMKLAFAGLLLCSYCYVNIVEAELLCTLFDKYGCDLTTSIQLATVDIPYQILDHGSPWKSFQCTGNTAICKDHDCRDCGYTVTAKSCGTLRGDDRCIK